jgi:hypothetical protein
MAIPTPLALMSVKIAASQIKCCRYTHAPPAALVWNEKRRMIL